MNLWVVWLVSVRHFPIYWLGLNTRLWDLFWEGWCFGRNIQPGWRSVGHGWSFSGGSAEEEPCWSSKCRCEIVVIFCTLAKSFMSPPSACCCIHSQSRAGRVLPRRTVGATDTWRSLTSENSSSFWSNRSLMFYIQALREISVKLFSIGSVTQKMKWTHFTRHFTQIDESQGVPCFNLAD